MVAYEHRPKQIVINRTPNKLGFPKKYTLSDLAYGDIYYDQKPVEHSSIKIYKRRDTFYRVKVKIREK